MHNKNKTLDFYVKQAWHSIYKMYNAVGEEYGITQAEGLVLLNIPKEGIPVTQIGPEVGIESTSLSRMLNKLEKKGGFFGK
ncbi:MAG: hypothetical protein D6707_01480 [Bacteroidetes bacterium]|nr:MAG: hypothetical protein D6707_01480 [Bacteroidota bacterium]